MSKLTYQIGRTLGKYPALGMLLLVLLAAGLTQLFYHPKLPEATPELPNKATQAPAWDEKKALAEKCEKTLPELMVKATAAYAQKDYDLAVDTLWVCQGNFSDIKVKEFYTQALTKRNKVKSDETDRYLKAEKARKKKEGVTIGMSEQDVLDSIWGKPQSINTTTNAYGSRAQWVYGGRNYLYFEDGKLTSIQH